MTPELNEAKILAEAAQRALDEHLSPAFELVETIYANRLKQLASKEPWSVDKIRALANALRISEEVRGQIESIVQGGEVAESQMKHLRKLESMSPERRKWLG